MRCVNPRLCLGLGVSCEFSVGRSTFPPFFRHVMSIKQIHCLLSPWLGGCGAASDAQHLVISEQSPNQSPDLPRRLCASQRAAICVPRLLSNIDFYSTPRYLIIAGAEKPHLAGPLDISRLAFCIQLVWICFLLSDVLSESRFYAHIRAGFFAVSVLKFIFNIFSQPQTRKSICHQVIRNLQYKDIHPPEIWQFSLPTKGRRTTPTINTN